MTELVLPPALLHARNSFRYIDSTGVTRGVYSGIMQTTAYGGDRVGATIEFAPHGGTNTTGRSQRAQLQSFLFALRSKQNRLYLTDNSYRQRGSFPTSEMLTNSDLSSISGWSAGADSSISASDQVLRVKRIANSAPGSAYISQAVSGLIANTPYAWRACVGNQVGTNAAQLAATSTFLSLYADAATAGASGYRSSAIYPSGTTGTVFVDNPGSSVSMAGDYYDITFASLSRCFLLDSPGNLITKSDEFEHANWTKSNATITANSASGPDGTSSAMDTLVENTATSFHYAEQAGTTSSAAQDVCFCVVVAAASRNFCFVEMSESTTPSAVTQYFNLGTGAVGASGATGAGWSNRRAFIVNLGGSRYMCCLVARKTTVSTAITFRVGSATADGTGSYTGTSANAILLWRGTGWPSSFPTRLVQSTTTAVATSVQPGAAIYIKGLPTSTAGLLLQGDWVEIDGQLKMVTAPLDSDAAGLGYLQFSPPLRRSIADNTPIIVNRPMGRFMLAADQFSTFSNEPGLLSNASIELEEAFA